MMDRWMVRQRDRWAENAHSADAGAWTLICMTRNFYHKFQLKPTNQYAVNSDHYVLPAMSKGSVWSLLGPQMSGNLDPRYNFKA
jgi:hypothetical protein